MRLEYLGHQIQKRLYAEALWRSFGHTIDELLE